MRDYVGEFAAISEDTDKEVMLTSLGAGEQALASFPKSPKSNPLAPGQFPPRGPVCIPMQDNRVVWRSLHRRLPSVTTKILRPAGGAASDQCQKMNRQVRAARVAQT